MSSPAQAATSPPAAGNSAPLRFVQHNIDAHCYDTLACSVIYAGDELTRSHLDTPSPAATDGHRERWGFASHIGVRNFPPPAQLRWTSKDGRQHQAEVDIGAIFADQKVLHRVPEAEIPDAAFVGPAGEPSIFIEVDDRTVRVFMKMFIPTRSLQVAGNPDSDFRADLIEAWHRTY